MGKRINVSLFLEDLERLDGYVKANNYSRSEAVREALSVYEGFQVVQVKSRRKKTVPIYFPDPDYEDLKSLKQQISLRYGIEISLSDLVRLAINSFLKCLVAKQEKSV